MTQAKEISALQHNFAKLPGSLALLDLPGIHRQLYGVPETALQTKGPAAEADQVKVDQESRQWAGQKGFGCQRGIDLLNEVVGLGHWRIITREAFIDEMEGCAGGKGYEAGFDVIVQLGNWTPQGFEVLAETPCTPGGHSASSRHEARAGALADAIKKALYFFGIGAQAPGGEPWNDSPAPETLSRGIGRKPESAPGEQHLSGPGRQHPGGPGGHPISDSGIRSLDKPNSEQVNQPVIQSIAQPASPPAIKPVNQSGIQTGIKAGTQSGIDAANEPVCQNPGGGGVNIFGIPKRDQGRRLF